MINHSLDLYVRNPLRENVSKTVIENYVIVNSAHDDEKLHTCHRAAVLAVHNGSFHEFHYTQYFRIRNSHIRNSGELLVFINILIPEGY